MAIPLIDGTSGARLSLKPVSGSSCNGCAYCCAQEPCGLAREFIPNHPAVRPCRALEGDTGQFVCGLIRHASRYLPDLPNDWADPHLGGIFAEALGAGKGCDADDL